MYARIALHTAVAAVAATAANLIIRALVDAQSEELAVRAVIVSTLAGVIGAGLVFALLAPRVRTYLIVVAVVLVLSLIPPLTLEGVSSGEKFALAAMHVVTAAICVAVLTRAVRPASP